MSYKKWRKSASILLAAKNIASTSPFNYKLLTLKRSKESSTNPNIIVFPGGILETIADSSKEWLKLFDKFGFPLDTFFGSNPVDIRPKIFLSEHPDEIPRCLSLRITAIRETFEETGILICRNNDVESADKFHWGNYTTLDNIAKWQRQIRDDPKEFLNLCYNFQVYPDILSLHDWSHWITPVSLPAKYNTVFFFTAFQNIPPTLPELNEVTYVKWSTPQKYEEERQNRTIRVLAPQCYEISRLRNFFDINGLLSFAQGRAPSGLEAFFPCEIFFKTEKWFLLPGDDLYPQNHDPNTPQQLNLEIIPNSQVQHRARISSSGQIDIYVCNYKPRFNHVLPVTNL